MADNVSITAGSGTTVAADDVGGVKYQRVKLALGDDGTVVDAVGGSGVTGTNTQRVVLATDVALPTGTNTLGAVKDAGPNWTSVFGVSGEGVTSSNCTATPLVITDAPTSGQKIVLTDVLISSDTATLLTIRTTTGVKKLARIRIPANGTIQWTPRSKTKCPTADQTVEVISADVANVYVTASYYSEA